MFGLEEQKKKKKSDEFVFNLERDLNIHGKHKELKARIESRLFYVRDQLKQGTHAKMDFDRVGVILQGYASILKIFSRFTPKEK